jgi:hypothetical protein
VAAAIQLALFSQPQPDVVVTHTGHKPWPYQLHCWPVVVVTDELLTATTDDTDELLAGTLEAGALDAGTLEDAALEVGVVPVALYTSISAIAGALVALTIRLSFFALRVPRFNTRSAPIPVPVAYTAPVSLSTRLQLVTLLPDSRRITVLKVTALPHLTDTRWLLVPEAWVAVAMLPSRTNLVLSKPEPSAPALGPVIARLEPSVWAWAAPAVKPSARVSAAIRLTRKRFVVVMLITLS